MATATGIEITGNTLRCVVLKGSARAPKLKTAFSQYLETAEDEENGLAERVGAALKDKGVPGGNTVYAVDGRQVYCREVVVPFTRTDQIQKTMKFEAEEFMPAAPVESMVVDHYKVAEIDGKSRVLVCGLQKPLIAETLEFCRKADIIPRAIDLDAACLANVAFAVGAFETPSPEKAESGEEVVRHVSAVALDVSPSVTRLVLVEDGRLRRTRTFQVALDPENPSEASLGKIVREIRRTEASCSLVAPVSAVYLTGPAYTLNLEAKLQQALGLEVKSLNLQALTRTENQDELRNLQAAGSIALGAALKALGIDNIALDFRKEEYAYRRAFDELKAGLACTAVLAFFMAFMLAYTFNLRVSQERYALDTLRGEAKETFLTLLPGEPLRDYETPHIFATFKNTLERRKSGRLSEKVPPTISALDIFKDFGDAVKRANAKFRLLECRIDQSSVSIRGVIENKLEGERISREIRSSSKYLIYDSDNSKEGKEGTEFSLRCKVKKPK